MVCNHSDHMTTTSHDSLVPERLWRKVEVTERGCWRWTASLKPNGYGQTRFAGTTRYAHRVFYELLVGEIPEGLVIDHLCRNRACVNPAHLEPVTYHENALRGEVATKTHCVHGHPFNERNTYRYRGADARPGERRVCRECDRRRAREYRARLQAVAA